MKTGIATAIVASLLVAGADRLWSQLAGHEADTWSTPAYGEGGAIATTAYGENGPWSTAAFNGVDAGPLKEGLGGTTTGAAAGPASRPRSSLGETPFFGAASPQKTAPARKTAAKPALVSTNAPSLQPLGSGTNAVPSVVPTATEPTSAPEPTPLPKTPSPGQTDKP